MEFLIVVASAFAGLFIGHVSGGDGSTALGFCGGLVFGLLVVRLRRLSARLDALRGEFNALRGARARQSVAPDVPTSSGEALGSDLGHIARPPPAPPPPLPKPSPARRSPAAAAHFADRLALALKRWFSEGNVPVKIGMLVLFAGVAALLRYASEQGWLRLPVELRLAGIALAAVAALGVGWRERARRRSFGLALQGGAIGVLLLSAFAAFRLYHLLPAGAAFALLLVLVASAGLLAVLQDALALAMLGVLAGFAAPILIATGPADHVVLFSYYALLNLAIFAIAWFRPWRALNLLGFVFTWAIATAWGVLRYEPALFASSEPFLLLHFAIYLAIPILYAQRQAPERRELVDGSLVFGNPLLAFAAHAALLDGARGPLAWSALALAAVYAALAWTLLPRARQRVLGEAFAVLAVGFATLAVPFAFGARSSASTFALEGAALVWLGLRERRRLPQLAGLALQALAALAFVFALAFGADVEDTVPIANGVCLGALLIAAAAFASARLYRWHAARPRLALLLYLWGLVWWLGAGLGEIERFVPSTLHAPALLAFVALTAALAALAYRRTLAPASAWTAALALLGAIALVLQFAAAGTRPFSGWGLAALAAYAAGGFVSLPALRAAAGAAPRFAQIGWLWTWTCAAALALRQFSGDAQLGAGWRDAATLLPLLVAWACALWRPAWLAAPMATRFPEHRGALLASQALVALAAFSALLGHAGDAAPIAYVPLLNPLDLGQLGLLACAARCCADRDAPVALAQRCRVVLAAAAFALATAATLRSVHQLGGVPWNDALWSSNLAQAALTVVWSVLGVLAWVSGSRRGQRALWLAGALLMGAVLAKLLLVDRSHLGNLFGIGSFIAYGLLCTLIGYLAPAPPREEGAI